MPKITDFGLSKQLENEFDRQEKGIILGTPSYMSPEQAWGNNASVGFGADIYSLGVVLYEMLTGRVPLRAADRRQTVSLVRHQTPVSPRSLVPAVPRDLELICLKCLKKTPGERYQSAAELADELRRFREGRPIKTRPAPAWERVWKWARRNPAVALLLVVGVLAAVSLLLYFDQRARGAERVLRDERRNSELRTRFESMRAQAVDEIARDAIDAAQARLRTASELVATDSSLADLKPALDALQSEVAEKADSLATFKRFSELRESALYQGMIFTGASLPTNLPRTRAACQEALALFGVTCDNAGPPKFPRHTTPSRKKLSESGCYELLLILAEIEAQSKDVPGAMKALDRAANLGQPETRAWYLRRANYLAILKKDDKQAREQSDRTVPRSALDHFLTGHFLESKKKLKEAAQSFTAALTAEPDHFWARYYLAVCNLQLQQPSQARDNLTACLVNRPELVTLFVYRGFANLQLDAFQNAEADFNSALKLEPDAETNYGILLNHGLLRVREGMWWETNLRCCDAVPPGISISGLLQAVAQSRKEERLLSAAHYFTKAAQLQPDHHLAYRYLAIVAQQQRDPEKATRFLNSALKAAKSRDLQTQAQLYSQRARVHRDNGKNLNAVEDLQTAIRLHESPDDLLELGRILHLQQKHSEAVAAYNRAIELRRQDTGWDVEVFRWKADALLALRKDEEAATTLDHYLALGGTESVEIFRTRGAIQVRLKQFANALADFTQALKIQPDAGTYSARGWVFLANDSTSFALNDFDAALKLSPTHSDAYAGRGLIHVRQNKHSLALADAQAALANNLNDSPRLFWNVAHIHAQLAASYAAKNADVQSSSHRDAAVSLLRRALKGIPESDRIDFWRQFIAPDGLLNPLRGSPSFERLAREYGR